MCYLFYWSPKEVGEDEMLKKWDSRTEIISFLTLFITVVIFLCYVVYALLPSPDILFIEFISSRCKGLEKGSGQEPTILYSLRSVLVCLLLFVVICSWMIYKIIPLLLLGILAVVIIFGLFNCVSQGRILAVKWLVPRIKLNQRYNKELEELDKKSEGGKV